MEKDFLEIETFIKKIKKSNIFLSPKERIFIKEFLSKGYSVSEIKKTLEKEIKKYPPFKRKKIPVYLLLKDLEKKPVKENKEKISEQEKKSVYLYWEDKLNSLNIPVSLLQEVDFSDEHLAELEIKGKVINYLWKKLSPEEKKKLQEKAVLKMKKMKLTSNIDKKEILKSLIAKEIEETYNL